jgi:hypothetical protein
MNEPTANPIRIMPLSQQLHASPGLIGYLEFMDSSASVQRGYAFGRKSARDYLKAFQGGSSDCLPASNLASNPADYAGFFFFRLYG